MKKASIIVPAMVAVIGFGLLHSGQVYAAEPATNFFSSLVDKIAQTFNLDRTKVESVVAGVRNEHRAEMREKLEEHVGNRLDTAVKNGKITEAQKQAILAKLAETKKNFNPDAFKNMTPEERKAAMEKQRADLQAWAKSQGIDPSFIMMGGRWKRGLKLQISVTPNP